MEHEERLKAALADRYQIEREIGSGGMATVYLALKLGHERNVAVKVLNPALPEPLGAERFLREIKTAGKLTHPHILPVYDAGEADGLLFYVMPFVKEGSLRARLDRERQLPVEDAVQIAREVADALAYAHGEGVIHRDVKPANIMLEEGHAVLADFGVAHAIAEAKEDRLTRTGTSLGTPAYMSPEQAAGEQDLDGRSDQYALGCVLYEMLAGHPPFVGGRTEAVLRQHLTAEPPPITRVRPSVPTEVAKAISRALAKNPADRFRTTGEMAAALAMTTGYGRGEPKKSANRLHIASGVASVIALGVAGSLVLRPGGETSLGTTTIADDQRPSIAVLPFDNFSPDPADAYFADGMQEQLVFTLSKIRGFSVKGRTSAMRYRDNPKPLPEIAEELGVSFIIEGSARVAGGQVSVTAQLIDAVRDEHMWADEYDRGFSVDEIVSIHRDIAEQIAFELKTVFTPAEKALLTAKPTEDLEAYDAFLNGRYWLARRTPEGLERANEYFRTAINQDSTFALAYAGLADVYTVIPWHSAAVDPREMWAEATGAVETALRLDPSSAEAFATRGYLRFMANLDREGAEADVRQAISLDPSYPTAHHYLADILGLQGRMEEALDQEMEALRLDRFSAISSRNLGNILLWDRQYDAALRQYEEATAVAPGVPTTWRRFAGLLLLRDSTRYAERALTRWAELSGADEGLFQTLPSQVLAFHRTGVAGTIPSQVEMAPFLTPVERAWVNALVGNVEGALRWLEEASVERWPEVLETAVNPIFDPLRSHPRFQALLEEYREDVEH